MSDGEFEIVLVEDNPHDAELISRVLRKHNLADHLLVLRDGAEALEFLLGEDGRGGETLCPPKLVLLDLKLPKIDGIEVLRRIKLDRRIKNVPVVVLTSSSEPRDLEDSYGLGVNSYVTKPIRFAEFSKVVAEVGLYWLLVNKLPTQ